jgi:hypothetical protein
MMYWVTLPVFFSTAEAARVGYIKVDRADLRAGPGTQYDKVEELPFGFYLILSNEPVQGYFKARTLTDQKGWVAAEDLIDTVPAAPEKKQSVLTETELQKLAETELNGAANTKALKGVSEQASPFRYFPAPASDLPERAEFRFLTGVSSAAMADFQKLTGFDGLKANTVLGLEMQLPRIRRKNWGEVEVAWGVRVEWLRSQAQSQDATTATDYRFVVDALPVSLGLHSVLKPLDSLSALALRANLRAMVSPWTQLQVNSARLGGLAPAFGCSVSGEVSFALSKKVFLYGEGSLRLMRTFPLKPAENDDGSELFRVEGTLQSTGLDFSGWGALVGLGFRLC